MYFGPGKSSLSHLVSIPVSYCQAWLCGWGDEQSSWTPLEMTLLSQRNGSCWSSLILVMEPRIRQSLEQKVAKVGIRKKKKGIFKKNFILFNFTIFYWFCHITKWKKALKSLWDKAIIPTWNSIWGPIRIEFNGLCWTLVITNSKPSEIRYSPFFFFFF